MVKIKEPKKIYLNAKFKDKDFVKALGAWFDVDRRRWFVMSDNKNVKLLTKTYGRIYDDYEEYKKIQDRKVRKINAKKILNKSLKGITEGKTILRKIEKKILKDHNYKIKNANFSYKKQDGLEIKISANKHKTYTRNDIKTIGNKLSKYLQKYKITGHITLATLFENDEYKLNKYMSGYQTKIGEDVNIFDADDYEEEEKAMFNTVNEFNDFTFYILLDKPEYKFGKKQGGKMEYNDCLYFCLEKTVKIYLTWTKPSSLKKFLKLRRFDMISIDLMEKIEHKINVGINITGDHIYTSKLNSNLNIHLILKNNHYTINHKVNQKIKYINYNEKKILMIDNDNKLCYNGIEYIELTDEFNSDVKCFRTDYIAVGKIDKKKALKDEYERYIRLANYLKEATKDKQYEINLYKTGGIANTSLKLLNDMTKHITPDDILDDEAIWIKESSIGAIIFAQEYDGSAYKYDIKSMYPSIISNNNVMCPIKRGDFKYISQEEFNKLKYFPTGIYNCKILKSTDENINKQFRFNKYNRYCNISLNHAKILNLTIEMIETETKENNTLLYPRNKCLTSQQVFKSYVDYLFPLKEKNKDVKLLLNIITGLIAQTNSEKVEIKADGEKVEIFDNVNIINLHKIGNNGDMILEIVKENNYFKSNFARLKPFLYAKARANISEYINPIKEHVIKCNTDSMILNKNCFVKTGSNIGDMVFEGYFHHIKIINNSKEKIFHWCLPENKNIV